MATITIDSTAAAERPQCRHAAGLKPDRRRDVDAVAAGEPGQQPLAHAGRKPGGEQQTDVALGTGLPRRFEQRRRVSRAPGELLSHVEQDRQEGRAKAGADSGQNDGGPEADRARVAQRRGNFRAGRLAQSRPRRRTSIPFPKRRLRVSAPVRQARMKRLARDGGRRKGHSRQLAPLQAFL